MRREKRGGLKNYPKANCTKEWEFSKKFNIKERILNKIGMDSNFEVKTLYDLSIIQENFGKTFRFDNSELLLNGSIDPDNEICIKRLLVEEKSDTCGVLSIVFGNFLTELGFNTRIYKACKTKYGGHHNHFFNVITWIDNKHYIVDVACGFFNPFFPIEIGGKEFSKNNTNYRIRLLEKDDEITDDKEIYAMESQSLLQGKDDSWKVIFTFDKNMKVSISTFVKSEMEYRNEKDLIVYILFDEGSYFLTKDFFLIKYHNGINKFIPIVSINHFIEIAFKYFKMKDINVIKEYFLTYKLSKL